MTDASQPGNSSLELGISAFKADNKGTARKHLADAIQQDPQNETAWLYMAAAIDDPQRRQQCLHHVLAINPDNQIAQRELSKVLPPAPVAPGPVVVAPVPATAQAGSVVPATLILLTFLTLYWIGMGIVQFLTGIALMSSSGTIGLSMVFDACLSAVSAMVCMAFMYLAYKRYRRTVLSITVYGLIFIPFSLASAILDGGWLQIIAVLLCASLIALVQIGKAEFTA